MREFINSKTAKITYYAHIYSRISYGIEVYGSASKNLLAKLQTLQNKLLKVLTKRDYRYSTNDLHTELDILKIEGIRDTALLKFAFNCVQKEPIPNFVGYFTRRNEIHNHNTRGQNNLDIPYYRTNNGRLTTHAMAAELWRSLREI